MTIRIRLHGRGGQGVKTSGRIISTACFLEGHSAEDSPMYGPERRGAPVLSFVRISNGEPIEERGYVDHPDAVVLLDSSLLSASSVSPLYGLRAGGLAIINSSQTWSETPFPSVALDVSSAALRLLKKDNVSAGAAALACKALGLASIDSVTEAVRMEMNEIGLKPELVDRNIELASECFSSISTVKPFNQLSSLNTDDNNDDPSGKLVEITQISGLQSVATILCTGNSPLNKTGLWRLSTPRIDYSKCTKCIVCFVYCPDSCITLEPDLTPHIQYEHCKGCMICATECPLHAINEEKLVSA